MKASPSILGVLLLGLLAAPVAAVTPNAFPFLKDVQPPGTALSQGALCGVVLDDEVLVTLNRAGTNLRLFDEAGVEQPFRLRPRTRRTAALQDQTRAAEVVSFKELPDNRVEIVLARKRSEARVLGLILNSSQKNFEKQVTVSGSEDQQVWTLLARDQAIYDYTRYIDLRNQRVDLPPSDYPYYRVEISNVGENRNTVFTEVIRQVSQGQEQVTERETAQVRQELFRVDRIDWLEQTTGPVQQQRVVERLDIPNFTVRQNDEFRFTVVDFETRRLPLVTLWLYPRQANFSRRVTVAGSDKTEDQEGWDVLATGTLSVVEAGAYRRAQLNIPLGGTRRYLRYRVTIHNLDNPPLDIQSLQADAESWELVYFPPATPLRLGYGGDHAVAPQFDIDTVLATVPDRDPVAWTLGPARPNPDFSRSLLNPRTVTGKTILVVAILAMVAVLIRIIARTARQIDAPPPA